MSSSWSDFNKWNLNHFFGFFAQNNNKKMNNLAVPLTNFFILVLLVSLTLHTILKVKFLSKNSIFKSFSPKFFLAIFLVKSKLSTAKKSKITTFSRIFLPKKIDNFHGKSKLNFWTKNEDFEQCVTENRVPSRANAKHRSMCRI